MKRQSLLLFGGLLLAIPAAVQAQFIYTVTNQMVTITGYTDTTDVVSIPSSINSLPVISIGDYAFSGSSITDVAIPNSVTSIGNSAFANCVGLTTVTIPNRVISLGDSAFSGSSLTNIILGSGVTSIGISAFSAAGKLGHHYGCPLVNVTIPNSVTNVGNYAFAGCFLTNVTIGNSVTSIGAGAFSDCGSLTNIIVDPLNPAFSSVDGVLFNQNQTTLVEYPGGKPGGYTIPNNVTSIAGCAFAGCFSLTSVTIPDSVTSVGDFAFSLCGGLTSVTIPNSVTSIRDSAFEYCCSLTSVAIPNSVTSIGAGAFFACGSLTSVTIPNNVTSIGNYGFAGCSSLTNILLGTGVTSIGNSAFLGCSSLTTVTIPNSVTSIGDDVFRYCGLTNITLGTSITSIGDFAFFDCSSLTSLFFQGNAPGLGGINVFFDSNATIYYLPGTVGWSSTFGGRPTALWKLPYPLILTSNPGFGVRTNQFGFTVSWATNLNVVVETATDLANPIWSPVQTNTLTSGSFYFSDPQWKNYPSRFYRVRSQ